MGTRLRGRSMDETPMAGQRQKWFEFVNKWEWNEQEGYKLIRLFGDVFMDFAHNITTASGKFYPEYCHAWDVDTCVFLPNREELCPCCALEIKGTHRYLMNCIDIEAEENKPSKPKADWSPIRFIDLSQTLFQRVKELKTVNKGVSVADTQHGAIIQVKYNSKVDPGSQYAASLDTKDVPISEEQKLYIVTQKYPSGESKIIRGQDGLPASFEYIRCVSSRDDMVKSLRRHGYYGETDESHSYDKPLSREELIAQIDAESPIETINIDNIFPSDPVVEIVDEDPTPKKTAKAKKEICDECPTEFGKFASTLDCFSNCGLSAECREATNKNPDSTPAKKAAPVIDDDDDTL